MSNPQRLDAPKRSRATRSTPTPPSSNTVTGLWNYAQHFAMSDNSFGDNFGPSTSGALNVISGDTYGAVCGPTSAVFRSTRARLHPVRGPRVSHRRTT